MIFKLFFSIYDSEDQLRANNQKAKALNLKTHSEYREVEASSLEDAVNIFLHKYADELANSLNSDVLYLARLLDDGSIKIL